MQEYHSRLVRTRLGFHAWGPHLVDIQGYVSTYNITTLEASKRGELQASLPMVERSAEVSHLGRPFETRFDADTLYREPICFQFISNIEATGE
jgi:hypothetical protein